LGVIGNTLFEARTRRAVDLEEVHAATGIRVRYLRAIEEEDWDALPEEFYARSFIRKYAQFLGVDPVPLVDEYRRQRGTGRPGEAPTSPFAPTGSRRAEALRRRRRRQGAYVWLGGAALVVAVIVAIVLVVSGGGEGGSGPAKTGVAAKKKVAGGGTPRSASGGATRSGTSRRFFRPKSIALAIRPTAEVWACVLDAKGKPLVDGATLAAGETVGPFHSRGYTAAFGNGQVAVTIDGKRAATPSTSSPMGFTVDRHGKLHQLPEGRRPSCE
jgi:cytoskeleton protein RodZ